MSTAAQRNANYLNASRSTGPRTPEGKAASSRNATTHGLAGKFDLLPGEDPLEFQALADAYEDEFQPAGEHECFLVTQMIQARWKLERIERLQAEAFNQMLATAEPQQTSDACIVAALGQPTTVMDRLERYAAQAERSYHRCHRELVQLRKQQAKASADTLCEELQNEAKSSAAALDARIDRIMHGPLPDYKQSRFYREELQNEANPVPITPENDDRALRL